MNGVVGALSRIRLISGQNTFLEAGGQKFFKTRSANRRRLVRQLSNFFHMQFDFGTNELKVHHPTSFRRGFSFSGLDPRVAATAQLFFRRDENRTGPDQAGQAGLKLEFLAGKFLGKLAADAWSLHLGWCLRARRYPLWREAQLLRGAPGGAADGTGARASGGAGALRRPAGLSASSMIKFGVLAAINALYRRAFQHQPLHRAGLLHRADPSASSSSIARDA